LVTSHHQPPATCQWQRISEGGEKEHGLHFKLVLRPKPQEGAVQLYRWVPECQILESAWPVDTTLRDVSPIPLDLPRKEMKE
jgi:hypothetical protein